MDGVLREGTGDIWDALDAGDGPLGRGPALCWFRRASWSFLGQGWCRRGPAAQDLKRFTAAWDIQMARGFRSSQCSHCSCRQEKIAWPGEQLARTDLLQVPHRVPHLQGKKEFTEGRETYPQPRWTAPLPVLRLG